MATDNGRDRSFRPVCLHPTSFRPTPVVACSRRGKKRPQGYCPAGQGQVNDLFTSSRGNYIVFSCSGGNAYLTYIGPK